MKFLRDDNWDNDGYCEYLKSIQHVFDPYTGEFGRIPCDKFIP